MSTEISPPKQDQDHWVYYEQVEKSIASAEKQTVWGFWCQGRALRLARPTFQHGTWGAELKRRKVSEATARFKMNLAAGLTEAQARKVTSLNDALRRIGVKKPKDSKTTEKTDVKSVLISASDRIGAALEMNWDIVAVVELQESRKTLMDLRNRIDELLEVVGEKLSKTGGLHALIAGQQASTGSDHPTALPIL